MIEGRAFVRQASDLGYGFFAGVPCSYLTPLMNTVLQSEGLRYLGAANEGDAVAAAAGAWLAGQKTLVMCQNSGLGNAVNPLTSLNHPFRIPTLLVVSHRGEPGTRDEPQHGLMGQVTSSLLELIGIPHRRLPNEQSQLAAHLEWADELSERQSLPVAFLVSGGTITEAPALAATNGHVRACERQDRGSGGAPPSRARVLESVLSVLPRSAGVIATTGKTGRELFTIDDRPQHFYQVGSMGCASSLGLGTALFTRRTVLVLDGDGAALMRMGAMATIGHYAPTNLVHLILDNGMHESTGGQFTVARSIDFATIGVGCGYASSTSCDSLTGLQAALQSSVDTDGPHLIHMRVSSGSLPGLGRPHIPPHEVARRFRDFLCTR